MWDNTPRKKLNGRVLLGATPQLYQDWLHAAVNQTRQRFSGDERIVFLNAWNEWAEGCHLEPDMRWGLAYLEATNAALRAAESQVADAPTEPASTVPLPSAMNRVRRRYWRAMNSARYLTQVGRSVIRMPMR